MATTEKKPMKTYTGFRTADEVRALAATKGFTVNTTRHDTTGNDHIVVYMPGPSACIIPVLYSTFNGRFFYAPSNGVDAFNSDNGALDGQPWFDAMLEFFYIEQVSG
jgi:hypothetical protein